MDIIPLPYSGDVVVKVVCISIDHCKNSYKNINLQCILHTATICLEPQRILNHSGASLIPPLPVGQLNLLCDTRTHLFSVSKELEPYFLYRSYASVVP